MCSECLGVYIFKRNTHTHIIFRYTLYIMCTNVNIAYIHSILYILWIHKAFLKLNIYIFKKNMFESQHEMDGQKRAYKQCIESTNSYLSLPFGSFLGFPIFETSEISPPWKSAFPIGWSDDLIGFQFQSLAKTAEILFRINDRNPS